MRGIPGIHVPGILEALAVVMTHDRGALAALAPVPASGIAAGR